MQRITEIHSTCIDSVNAAEEMILEWMLQFTRGGNEQQEKVHKYLHSLSEHGLSYELLLNLCTK